MTIYMKKLFQKSNSSFLLSSGKAITAQVSRFKDNNMFIVDAGIGTPKLTTHEEIRSIPANPSITTFENKVGFVESTGSETLIKTQMLERMFVDLVAGEPAMKERATARFNDIVAGSVDSVSGEPAVMMPRRFLQKQVWSELGRMWNGHKKVRGFLLEKVRGGYAVAVAGYIGFLPFRSLIGRRKLSDDKYLIESFNSKRNKFTLF
uniref:ribosomal protein S1, mitochondrial-like n=1 Tax=Erigeron canadensis TaxID=72917 RepID=UPI001CB8F229|nr:ribosomal protein S1, mitochondrial-like [Erigeron canadensis]